jgi:ribosomal-protein-serine acetyltransferase
MIIKDLQINTSLKLKVLDETDSQPIFDAIDKNRLFLRTWLPFVDATRTVNDSKAFVKSIVDDVERRQEVFSIWFDDKFCGLIGLKDIDYLNRKIEIGYWLVYEMTGKGIMTLALERIIEFIFRDLEMNRIQIRCGVGNIKSSNLPKKFSFHFEGIERQGERYHTKYIDLEVFSLLRKEWEKFS